MDARTQILTGMGDQTFNEPQNQYVPHAHNLLQ